MIHLNGTQNSSWHFETMITAFTTAPAFHDFDHESEVIIETDASN